MIQGTAWTSFLPGAHTSSVVRRVRFRLESAVESDVLSLFTKEPGQNWQAGKLSRVSRSEVRFLHAAVTVANLTSILISSEVDPGQRGAIYGEYLLEDGALGVISEQGLRITYTGLEDPLV